MDWVILPLKYGKTWNAEKSRWEKGWRGVVEKRRVATKKNPARAGFLGKD